MNYSGYSLQTIYFRYLYNKYFYSIYKILLEVTYHLV